MNSVYFEIRKYGDQIGLEVEFICGYLWMMFLFFWEVFDEMVDGFFDSCMIYVCFFFIIQVKSFVNYCIYLVGIDVEEFEVFWIEVGWVIDEIMCRDVREKYLVYDKCKYNYLVSRDRVVCFVIDNLVFFIIVLGKRKFEGCFCCCFEILLFYNVVVEVKSMSFFGFEDGLELVYLGRSG